MTQKLQLECAVIRQAGGEMTSHVTLLPNEMAQLDGKSVKIDGETIRFKMWKGIRLYVNQRKWTLGFFEVEEWHLSWGNPMVAHLQSPANANRPSPLIAQAVSQLLGVEECRILEM